MSFLDPLFDSLFGFLLNWTPLLSITVVSLAVSIVIVIAYKLLTNQSEMKHLKEELAGYQKKMKTLKDDPEKLMSLQKQAMSVNMQYMSKSMKPTLITFIPILLIFGWMNAHFTYEPLLPGAEFEIHAFAKKGITGDVAISAPEGLEVAGDKKTTFNEGIASFKLKGEEGEYLVTLASNGQEIDKDIIITTEKKYAPVSQNYESTAFEKVELGNKPLKVIWKLSWIWVYIIFAILFSTVLRKALKVY